jgi:nicotinamide-nucleotide amidase
MTTAAAIVERYRKAGLRIVTAESCTGGMIAAALTDVAGSSDIFERGFVTYSNDAKQELIAVPRATLDAHGAVSAETAEAMAQGALAHSHADVALSVTGIAGPGGGSKEKPVGLVYFGVARQNAAIRIVREVFAGDRAAIRRAATMRALELLESAIATRASADAAANYAGRRVVGIDFSGAKDAGRRIWIAEGEIDAAGHLMLAHCAAAREKLGCGTTLAQAMPVLVEWIATQHSAIIGCDFPFSLPTEVIPDQTWHEFARSFGNRFPNAQSFHDICHVHTGGKEPKRVTDLDAKTPWCAFNLQMFYQTYAGIGQLLAPLIGRVSIAPFDKPETGKPLLVETCPASTLTALQLYKKHQKYKKFPDSHIVRALILDALIERHLVVVPTTLRERIVADKGGDALDSVIAAIGAVAALPQIDAGVGYGHPIEGWVYYVRR